MTYLGARLNMNIMNLVASGVSSLYKLSKRYLTNEILALVSAASLPRNGLVADNRTYARTPTDQISVCGYAGSSLITSGAGR